MIPVQRWCRDHHIAFTGHFMEDGWPKPYFSVVAPCVMSYYEYQDWPGIDLLLTGRLKKCSSEPQEMIMLEVMSAAHQFGKERVFCEAFGAGGYDSGLEDYKRIGDYLFAGGINFINEHLTYTSYVGARKRDHPQSFDWRQPWWKEFGALNDYFGRISAVLSQGKSEERILVLNPTVTGFLEPKNADASQLVYGLVAQNPDTGTFLPLIHRLRAEQWDINLGDEYIMQRHGCVNGGKLEIGEQKYDVVILHDCIRNMLRSTAELLKQFLAQGGQVLSLGKTGDFINGEFCPQVYDELYAYENCAVFADQEGLLSYLHEHSSRYFECRDRLPIGVESIRRVLEDGTEIYFMTNHSKTDVHTELRFKTRVLEKWDPWTGKMELAGLDGDTGYVTAELSLKDGESYLFLCAKETDSCLKQSIKKPEKAPCSGRRTLIPEKIMAEEKNSLPLEYCDVEIDGESYRSYSTIAAGNLVYQKRGFLRNPWDSMVQYKDHTYQRNRYYAKDSGFTVRYYFETAEGYLPGQVELAVEYGARYRVLVNGNRITEELDEEFMDPLIVVYDISRFVKPGQNTIELEAVKFDVELEVEPVILRGDFGVFQRDGRWVIDHAKPLTMGGIAEQGYPFYAGAVLYKTTIDYTGKEEVALSLSELAATAVSVSVNEKPPVGANRYGRRGIVLSDELKEGENRICVRLCASLKNLYGPHFDPYHFRNMAWTDMWKRGPKTGMPSAEEYDLINYGLEQIVLEC